MAPPRKSKQSPKMDSSRVYGQANGLEAGQILLFWPCQVIGAIGIAKFRKNLDFGFLRKISLFWIGFGKRAVNDQNDPKKLQKST